MATQLAILFGLIAINGLFAMSELAVLSARRARLTRAAEDGDKGARAALRLLSHATRFLSTVQIGITLVSVLTGAIGGATIADDVAVYLIQVPLLAPYAKSGSIALTVIGITYLTLIFGELVPKRLAITHPEKLAARLAPVLAVIARILGPVSWLLSASTELVLRFIPGSKGSHNPVTDEEIKILMREGAKSGHFEEAERTIVEMTLRLGDRRISALMTPRTQIEIIDLEDEEAENRQRLLASRHTRFPVVEGGFDKIVGVLEVKDLLDSMIEGRPIDLRAAARAPLFIPDTVLALKALERFRETGSALALIVDEYGAIEGLVTLTDILESLIGELIQPGAEQEAETVRRPDGSWMIDGMVPIDEVMDLVGARLPEIDGMDYETLGGFMMAQLKRIPAAGDIVMVDGNQFEVVEMDGRRVDKVLIVPPPDDENETATD